MFMKEDFANVGDWAIYDPDVATCIGAACPAPPSPPPTPPTPSTPPVQSPFPPPAPSLPTPAPGAAVFKVTTAFTIGGDVGDYTGNPKAQSAIKSVLATSANVSTSAVELTFTAGSVLVSATIFVASEAEATAKTSTLASGVLASPASLEAALTAEFTAAGLATTIIKVAAITSQPTVATTAPTAGGGGAGVAIGGAVGGVAAVLALLAGGLYYRQKKLRSSPPTVVQKEMSSDKEMSGV